MLGLVVCGLLGRSQVGTMDYRVALRIIGGTVNYRGIKDYRVGIGNTRRGYGFQNMVIWMMICRNQNFYYV